MKCCMVSILMSIFAISSLPADERPNILFVFTDDHALNAISAYGGPLKEVAPTPNLDRLAEEGAIFTRSYCSNSICGPSRAAILTGKHSHINGYVDNNSSHFDGSQTTFPKLLRKVGYQTALIGKWHLKSTPEGFDHWEVLPGQGSYYNPDLIQMDGSRKRYTGHCTDIVTDLALDWLKDGRDRDKPFLLMCQHKAPHRNWSPALRHADLFDDIDMPEPKTLFDDYANRHPSLKEQAMSIEDHFFWGWDMKLKEPNQFPELFMDGLPNGEYKRMNAAQKAKWDASYESENQAMIEAVKAGELKGDDLTRWKYQRYVKDYLRCIRGVDESIGKLLGYLDESGLDENTIVIYSSDQGFYLGEHGWYDKRWMFEESLEMPFLIRWPGTVKPGTRSGTLIQNIDYAPTFLEIAGAGIPETIQGRSILPVLKNDGVAPDDWREAIYYYYSGERTHAVAAHDGVRSERYKLMHFTDDDAWNLFDLEKDPMELKSVADDPAYAEVLAKMKKRYHEQREKYQMNLATLPAHRNDEEWWLKRRKQVIKEVKKGGHELVFIGDSITQGWEGAGKDVWNEFYADRQPLNLGYSGDRTEHVLFRLLNGELENVDPKAYVVMIGTNNTGHLKGDPENTTDGIELIVELLRDRSPEAEIVLIDVFPRGHEPDHELRKINDEVNRLIAPLGEREKVIYLPIGDAFTTDDGVLPKEIMPDFLHPKQKGYRIWAEAMEPTLKEILK